MRADRLKVISIISLLSLTYLFFIVFSLAVTKIENIQAKKCEKGLTEYNKCFILKKGSVDCWFKVKATYSYCPEIVGYD